MATSSEHAGTSTPDANEAPQRRNFCIGLIGAIYSVFACLLFSIFLLVLLLCCIPCFCIFGCPNLSDRPPGDLEAMMLAAFEEAENKRRRPEETVKEYLFSQTIEHESAAGKLVAFVASSHLDQDDGNKEGNGPNVVARSWNSAVESVRSMRIKPSCSICMEEYKAGDTLAWSKNPECGHVFHESCIVEWLKLKDDCPLCRAVIVDESNVDPEDVFTGDGEIPDPRAAAMGGSGDVRIDVGEDLLGHDGERT